MVRSSVLTRQATVDDLPTLMQLWNELRDAGGRAGATASRELPANVAERLRSMIADPGCRVLLATGAGEPVGMALLSTAPLGPLSDLSAVHLSHAVVRQGHRRRGVGRAMVAAAVAYAEEVGADHVVVTVYPGMREAHRFYARCGFAPMTSRRVASVASLRRRLAGPERRQVVDVVRRRGRLPAARPRAAVRLPGR